MSMTAALLQEFDSEAGTTRRVLERVPQTRGIGIERLGEACGLEPGALLATLLELELRGLVRQLPGRRFLSAACKIGRQPLFSKG